MLLEAFILGLTYAAAPGGVNTETVRRGLQYGFRTALRVQAGALIGHVAWAAVAVTGLAAFASNSLVQALLGLAGGTFLLWISWSAIRAAWTADVAEIDAPAAERGAFAAGVWFGLANPVGVVFWLGGMSGTVTQAGAASYTGFIIAATSGALVWVTAITSLTGWGRRYVSAALFRWINLGCGALLGYFGGAVLYRTVSLIWS